MTSPYRDDRHSCHGVGPLKTPLSDRFPTSYRDLIRPTVVNVYPRRGDQQELALAIPISDINLNRLALSPVKWIRFAVFVVCEVSGHLSTMPNSPPFDYTLTGPLAQDYTPEGKFHVCNGFS